jgi:hypothetical protein
MSRARNAAVAAIAAVVVLGAGLSLVRADVATPRPQWTMVRMESESVSITLGEKRVAVVAVFNMYNEGKAGPVRMGYPVGTFETDLHDFTVTIDGQPVGNIRTETGEAAAGAAPSAPGRPGRDGGKPSGAAPAPASEPYRFEGPYKQWKVFDVDMQEHAPRTIKITYWVEPARVRDAERGDLLHYTYTLRTGATWKGKINQAVVTVTLDGVAADRLVRVVPAGETRAQDGKSLAWTFRDFKPAADVEITFRPSEPVRTAAANRTR